VWVRVFGEAVSGLEGVEPRKMFGYPAAFVNGNLFAGLHSGGLVLRLPEAERVAFLERVAGAKPFEPMPGRPMREYVVGPESLAAKPTDVRAWMRKALAYGATLPAKSAGRKKSKSR
jgi:TfoX/Sxy family transcriptional regulator of competence genes